MTDTFSKKPTSYLESNNADLKSLFNKIKWLDQINTNLMPFLDEGMREYCQAVNLIGSRLTLVVANGSIATQIRFQAVDLIRKFKGNPILGKVQDIQCKVNPSLAKRVAAQRNPQMRPMQPLSSETAEMIKEMAESLDDPVLKEIMQRIAGRKK